MLEVRGRKIKPEHLTWSASAPSLARQRNIVGAPGCELPGAFSSGSLCGRDHTGTSLPPLGCNAMPTLLFRLYACLRTLSRSREGVSTPGMLVAHRSMNSDRGRGPSSSGWPVLPPPPPPPPPSPFASASCFRRIWWARSLATLSRSSR